MVYKVTSLGRGRQMMVSSLAPRISDGVETPEIRELHLAHIMLAEGRDLSPNIEALKTVSPDELNAATNLAKHLLKEIKSHLYDINFQESYHKNVTFTEGATSISSTINLASRKIISELEKDFQKMIDTPGKSTEGLYAKLVLLEESLLLLKVLDEDSKQVNYLEKKIDSIKSNTRDFVRKVKSHYKRLETLESQLDNSKDDAHQNLMQELNRPFSFLTEEEFDNTMTQYKYGSHNEKTKDFLLKAATVYNNAMQSKSVLGLFKVGILAKHYASTHYLWDFKTEKSYRDALTGYGRLLKGYLINQEEHDKKVKDFKRSYNEHKKSVSKKAHKDFLNTHRLMSDFKVLQSHFGIKEDKIIERVDISEQPLKVTYDDMIAIIEGDSENVVIVYPDPFVSVPGATYAVQVPVDIYKVQGIPEFTREFRDTCFGKATNFMSMDDALTQISTDEFTQRYFFNKFVEVDLNHDEQPEPRFK